MPVVIAGAFITALLAVVAFILLIGWIVLLIGAIGDNFGRDDQNVLAKIAWLVLMLALPLVGVGIYFAVNGKGLSERRAHGY